MSNLCANTVAGWFVDVYRVAGPGLEAREGLQEPAVGTHVPGFPQPAPLLGNAYRHASFAAATEKNQYRPPTPGVTSPKLNSET